MAFHTDLSREALFEVLRENSQEKMASFRNSHKLFVGSVDKEPIRLRHRQYAKRHDPREYKLTMFLEGWVERHVKGNVLRFDVRPGFEFYAVPMLFLAIGAAYRSWHLAAFTGLVVAFQTFLARQHLAEIEDEVGILLGNAQGRA